MKSPVGHIKMGTLSPTHARTSCFAGTCVTVNAIVTSNHRSSRSTVLKFERTSIYFELAWWKNIMCAFNAGICRLLLLLGIQTHGSQKHGERCWWEAWKVQWFTSGVDLYKELSMYSAIDAQRYTSYLMHGQRVAILEMKHRLCVLWWPILCSGCTAYFNLCRLLVSSYTASVVWTCHMLGIRAAGCWFQPDTDLHLRSLWWDLKHPLQCFFT